MAQGSPDVQATWEQVVATPLYEGAVRRLDQQKASVDELRNRTGVLLSAVTIATSFLGGAAAMGRGTGFHSEFLLGILPFAVVVILCAYILSPRKGWVFALSIEQIQAEGADRPAGSVTGKQVRYWLASTMSKHARKNQQQIDKLYWIFNVALVALITEVIAWLVVIV
jgi:hypothetical protein